MILARYETRLRLLVQQVQALVAGEEIDPGGVVHRAPGQRLEEIQRVADRIGNALIGLAQLGVTHKAQIPVFRMMQVGKSAIHQCAHEVQRQRRALVAAQQQLRVGTPGLGRELHTIHQITAIRRQRHAVARFHVG